MRDDKATSRPTRRWNDRKSRQPEQPGTDDTLDHRVTQHLRTDFTALCENLTVGEAFATLQSQQLGEKIVYLYVVKNGGKLVGVVPTRRLLMAAPEETLGSIMIRNVVALPSTATVLDACEFFIQHRFLALPVIDERRQLVGVVDVTLFTSEVFGVAEQKSSEDVFQLIGVHVARHRKISPWHGFRDRFPWLLCNISGGLLCAFLAGCFEDLLDAVIVLALFVPVVLALSESVSMQSMTILLQGLHEQRIRWGFVARALSREFFVACLLGLASGATVGLVAWAWKGDPSVALVLAGSIALSIVAACLFGVALPIAVRVLRADPKIAAGPIVLACADVATLLFYFNLAGWSLS